VIGTPSVTLSTSTLNARPCASGKSSPPRTVVRRDRPATAYVFSIVIPSGN
jgi:hypothetical protein